MLDKWLGEDMLPVMPKRGGGKPFNEWFGEDMPSVLAKRGGGKPLNGWFGELPVLARRGGGKLLSDGFGEDILAVCKLLEEWFVRRSRIIVGFASLYKPV